MRKPLSFDLLLEFEEEISAYTGAPYVVLTDCCTHALEMCILYKSPTKLSCSAHTYLSVPMMLHKLKIPFTYNHKPWQFEYQLEPSNIWDSARAFNQGMYRKGALQCVSFGHSKRLEIGHGGCILTDNKEDYLILKQMAFDGRDLNISPWQNQKEFRIGYHYYMRLEDAQKGLDMLRNGKLNSKESQIVNYPDCSKLNIKI